MKNCSFCGAENEDAAVFCEECRKSFSKKCDKCGAENKLTAKFCNKCGARFVAPNTICYTATKKIESLWVDENSICHDFEDGNGYIVLNDGVDNIGNFAFVGCNELTSVIVPNSITTIGDGAFSGCRRLISINIPESVTCIGALAFADCRKLASVVMPDSKTTIDVSVFPNTNLHDDKNVFFGCKNAERNTKLIVIGDIHGRDSWKRLIDKTALNVFVGDYFDPYDYIPYDVLKSNFLEIMDLKNQYPDNVVLLYGNHDFHYIYERDEASRYDYEHEDDILRLFSEFKHNLYGVAYSPCEKCLISHAGLTKEWVNEYLPNITENAPVKDIEVAVNELWKTNKYAFSFEPNCTPEDYFGYSPQHGPLWVRDKTLYKHAFNKDLDWIQIVGHTCQDNIEEVGMVKKNLVFVDCLGVVEKAFETYMQYPLCINQR